MHSFSSFFVVLFVGLSSVSVAQAMTASELKELKTDCAIEGEAMGMTGVDLDGYIEECVSDFSEANMTNSEKGEFVK